jgi:hypothetical protein
MTFKTYQLNAYQAYRDRYVQESGDPYPLTLGFVAERTADLHLAVSRCYQRYLDSSKPYGSMGTRFTDATQAMITPEFVTYRPSRLIRMGWVPSGFPIELADCFVQTLALAQAAGHEMKGALSPSDFAVQAKCPARLFNTLHSVVSEIVSDNQWLSYQLAVTLVQCQIVAEAFEVELMPAVDIQLEYLLRRYL